MSEFTKEETQKMVDSCPYWYHAISVGHGIVTPGKHSSDKKLETLFLPKDLSGWTVLDIGANDGYFCFVCEERGAKEVMATDFPHWTGRIEYYNMGPPRKNHFETARELRGSQVQDKSISIYDISELTLPQYDLVLCLGVLYHLVHFTLGLERAVSQARKLIIVETACLSETIGDETPSAVFTPEGYADDPTNWWYPNIACVKAMMLTFGCEEVVEMPRDPRVHRPVLHGYKSGYTPDA